MIVYQIVILVLLLVLFLFTRKNLADFKKPAAQQPIPKTGPLVSILIPARNEEKSIEACIRSAMRQTYSPLEIRVLDDQSTDATASIARRLAKEDARVGLIPGGPLLPGWTGKMNALRQLAGAARGEWLLFCDADTRLNPDCVAAVVQEGKTAGLDGLSLFPRQTVGTLAEKLVIPLIFFILTSYLPLREVRRNPNPAFSAGCGQFFFLRKKIYGAIGGFEAIRATLHDGPKLAALLKQKGRSYDLYDGQELVSCRMYTGLPSLWIGLTRSFYTGLNSPLLLFANLLWHFLLFVAPLFFLAAGWLGHKPFLPWIALPAAQLLAAAALRWLQNAQFGFPVWPALLLTPFSMSLFCLLQLHSFLRHKLFRSVAWKGRAINGFSIQ